MIAPTHNGVHDPGVPEGWPGIAPHHRWQLEASGISQEMATRAGLRSEFDLALIASRLNFRKWPTKNGGVLVIPYCDRSGTVHTIRVRCDNPFLVGGKPAKYVGPKGSPPRLYFAPGTYEALDNIDQPVFFTEGEKKGLSLTQYGFPAVAMPGVRCYTKKKFAALNPDFDQIKLEGRLCYIVFDSDVATNPDVQAAESGFAAMLATRGAKVKVVRIPPAEDGEKVGADDFLAKHGSSEFHKLVEAASDPLPVDPSETKAPADALDPATEAERYWATCKAGEDFRLWFWRGAFHGWHAGKYSEIPNSEIEAYLFKDLNTRFFKLGRGPVANVLAQLRAVALLPMHIEQPTWINKKPGDWPIDEVLPGRSGLARLSDLADGKAVIVPSTPRFFSSMALNYDIQPNAPLPVTWLGFLDQLWPDDQQSKDLLGEWLGYCLTPDASQHKAMMMIGPPRSGKSTISRIVRALIGPDNVAGPTLASLETNFGLAQFLGKSLAIFGDARLSGRSDTGKIVDRLLSISGQDPQSIDRKHREHVSCILNTRIMLLSNELPRLGDASGAIASRFLLLRMTRTFYGKEDPSLTDKLMTELPGILIWAAAGWKQLKVRGHFVQPDSSKEAIEDLADIVSPIKVFVRECCIVGPQYRSAVDDLYAAWIEWCKEQGREHPGTKPMFGKDLTAALPALKVTQPRDSEGGRYRVYEGIGIVSTSTSTQGF